MGNISTPDDGKGGGGKHEDKGSSNGKSGYGKGDDSKGRPDDKGGKHGK